jgi:uncharacterized membrane protein HdeD (DUF308 family)
MSEQAMALAQKGVPWRRGVAWWIVGIEGAILTVVGIYVVAAPDDARDIVRQIIGWFLLANAVLAIAASLRGDGPTNPITPYRMLAAGVGLTVGLLVALEPVSDYVDSDAAKVILALGLLGHGLIGLVGAFATRASGGLRRGALIGGGLNVAIALLLFYNVRKDALDPRWFGIIAIIGGVLVLGFAYMLYRDLHSQSTVETAPSPLDESALAPTAQPLAAVAAPAPPPVEVPAPATGESAARESPATGVGGAATEG